MSDCRSCSGRLSHGVGKTVVTELSCICNCYTFEAYNDNGLKDVIKQYYKLLITNNTVDSKYECKCDKKRLKHEIKIRGYNQR